MAQHIPSQHRPSCGGFSLCGVPPVVPESSHLLNTTSAAAAAVTSHIPAAGEQGRHGHHAAASTDGKRRISTCSGYSTATGFGNS